MAHDWSKPTLFWDEESRPAKLLVAFQLTAAMGTGGEVGQS